MTDNKIDHTLVIPAFQKSQEIQLVLNCTREAERRLPESKMVNAVTYSELAYCFNEAYRELKRHMATIGYEITKAEAAVQMAKSTFLIDKYPDIMKDRPKTADNADLRNAYLMRELEYVEAMERVSMLKATEAHIDGKIKHFEKTCQDMRKAMDLLLRSGLSGTNIYSTQGNK